MVCVGPSYRRHAGQPKSVPIPMTPLGVEHYEENNVIIRALPCRFR